MHPILWIAFFLSVWAALAVWTISKARRTGVPFDTARPATRDREQVRT